MSEATKTKENTKETPKKSSVYSTLAKIDVQPYISKKMGLNYLSWAKAWGLVKAIYPDASYKYTEYDEYLQSQNGWVPTGRTVDYRLTPAGCEVEVTVTIDGVDTKEQLYVMDNRNRPVKNPDYGQINKAQKRCLVKALANAGLGLEVYAGEDLPSDETETAQKVNKRPRAQSQPVKQNSLPTFSEEQLNSATVPYNGTKMSLKTIYEQATQGTGEEKEKAAKWWNNYKSKPTTQKGNMIVQADKLFSKQ